MVPKRVILCILVICVLAAYTPAGALCAEETDISGNWVGSLKVSGIELRIIFRVTKSDTAGYKAVMDSPDQGAKDIPVSGVEVDGRKVIFSVDVAAGRFEGELDESGKFLKGNWYQGTYEVPLELEKNGKAMELSRPQEPKPPFPYTSEDLKIENKEGGVTLGATLTLPSSGGPFPAVVMLTGSGPQNRDEEIFGHKPFLVIADHLARNGIASLRYDDRGVGESTGGGPGTTIDDFATDAEAAIAYLADDGRIDTDRIGLLGHSEGGMVSLKVAAESRKPAFLVLLATPGVSGYDIIMDQVEDLSLTSGLTGDTAEENRETQRKILDIVRSDMDDSTAVEKLRELQFDHNMIPTLVSPAYRAFISFDPRKLLAKIECPVLALNGSLDIQVRADKNLAAIEKGLKRGGNRKVKVKNIEGANHLFQTAETGLLDEYGKIEETIKPEVLNLISEWIKGL